MCCSAATGRCNQTAAPVLGAALPLYISISETIRGAPALRLAGAERFALDQVLHHYDNNLRSWYTTTSINRWLGMHQTLLSAALVGGRGTHGGLWQQPAAGAVAITYAFTASAMLNSLIRTFAEGGTGDERGGAGA